MPDTRAQTGETKVRAQITLELSWFDESDSSDQIARKIAELVKEHTTADVGWWEGQELELVVHHITELGFTRRETEWVLKDDSATQLGR